MNLRTTLLFFVLNLHFSIAQTSLHLYEVPADMQFVAFAKDGSQAIYRKEIAKKNASSFSGCCTFEREFYEYYYWGANKSFSKIDIPIPSLPVEPSQFFDYPPEFEYPHISSWSKDLFVIKGHTKYLDACGGIGSTPPVTCYWYKTLSSAWTLQEGGDMAISDYWFNLNGGAVNNGDFIYSENNATYKSNGELIVSDDNSNSSQQAIFDFSDDNNNFAIRTYNGSSEFERYSGFFWNNEKGLIKIEPTFWSAPSWAENSRTQPQVVSMDGRFVAGYYGYFASGGGGASFSYKNFLWDSENSTFKSISGSSYGGVFGVSGDGEKMILKSQTRIRDGYVRDIDIYFKSKVEEVYNSIGEEINKDTLSNDSWIFWVEGFSNNFDTLVGRARNSETEKQYIFNYFTERPIDIELSHYHQILGHESFSQRKLISKTFLDNASNTHLKICADGSKASVIKLKTEDSDIFDLLNVTLRMKDDPIGSDFKTYGKLEKISSNNVDSVVYSYTHPKKLPFDFNELNENYILEVYDIDNLDVLFEINLKIYRPPVLMVHGLWSDSSSYKKMENSFLTEGLYIKQQLLRADYKESHDLEFAANNDVVPASIDSIIEHLSDSKIAAGKVDIVGHSMGGLLTRLYLQSSSYQNDINKIITCNTPHSGSQAANFLADKSSAIGTAICLGKEFIEDQSCFNGAVYDLRVNSPTILNDLNGASLNSKTVPSHAVITKYTVLEDSKPFVESFNDIMRLVSNLDDDYYKIPVRVKVFIKVVNGIGQFTQFAIDFFQQLFNNNEHDLIVAENSQTGGLQSSQTSLIPGHQPHFGASSNTQLINQVINLLKANPEGSLFSQNGFMPEILNEPFTTPNGTNNFSQPLDLEITEPANGFNCSPGDTIKIPVNGSQSITGLVLLIKHPGDQFYRGEIEGNSGDFTFIVDNDGFGKREILVSGYDAINNQIVFDSSSINITSDTIHNHIIQIQQGWNMISSNLTPQNTSINEIVSEIENEIIIIKNGNGQTTIPSLNIDGIGTWNITEGYQIKTSENTELNIMGNIIEPTSINIPINIGWQIIPYLRQQPQNIEAALFPIQDDIIIVKDNDGNIYSPSLEINTIGEMRPGQGYFLKSKNDTDFNYTEN